MNSRARNSDSQRALKLRDSTLGTAQFGKLIGATVRQLQYWDEQGLLTPTHKLEQVFGGRRYSRTQVRAGKKLALLSCPGVSLETLRVLSHTKFTTVVRIDKPVVFGRTLVIPLSQYRRSRRLQSAEKQS